MRRQTEQKLQNKPPKKLKKAKRLEVDATAVARGTEIGKIQGQAKKSVEQSLKEHMSHWIDSINPLELFAIGSGTYIVHELIVNTPLLMQKASVFGISATILGAAGVAFTYVTEHLNLFGENKPEKLSDDWRLWVISFFASFVIVRHGGQLLGLMKDGAGSLSTVVGALLG